MHRVVPWRDHEHDTEGAAHDSRLSRPLRERYPDPLAEHPLAQVSPGVVDRVHDDPEIGRPAFDARLAQVGMERVEQLRFTIDEQGSEACELIETPCQGTGRARLERRSEPCDVLDDGGGHSS